MAKVIVGCEESQVVTTELRKLGHEAYSCDLLPTSGEFPEWHIQGRLEYVIGRDWDAGIFFPPCDYLTLAGNRWIKDQPPLKSGKLVGKDRIKARDLAIEFFMLCINAHHIPKIAVENPIGIMSTQYRKPDQIIQPWMFGHPEIKPTCLWLKGLPKLNETENVYEYMMLLPKKERERIHYMTPSDNRSILRSRTFSEIGKAMANQWFGEK